MFRTYIINQLTQASTWYGFLIIAAALLFPKSWILVLGLLILITDDTKITKFFASMRHELETRWKP